MRARADLFIAVDSAESSSRPPRQAHKTWKRAPYLDGAKYNVFRSIGVQPCAAAA